jgi:hypothetical protein
MTGSIELLPELKRILSPIAPPPLVYVDVADPGGRAALGGAINEAADPVSGNVVLVLNNFSNGPRVVTVEEGMKVADLIGHRKEEKSSRARALRCPVADAGEIAHIFCV